MQIQMPRPRFRPGQEVYCEDDCFAALKAADSMITTPRTGPTYRVRAYWAEPTVEGAKKGWGITLEEIVNRPLGNRGPEPNFAERRFRGLDEMEIPGFLEEELVEVTEDLRLVPA